MMWSRQRSEDVKLNVKLSVESTIQRRLCSLSWILYVIFSNWNLLFIFQDFCRWCTDSQLNFILIPRGSKQLTCFFSKTFHLRLYSASFQSKKVHFFWFLHGLPETLDGYIWLIFGILPHYGHISRAFFHFFLSTIFWPDFVSWKLHFGHFLLFSGDLWGRAVVALMAGGDVFLFF